MRSRASWIMVDVAAACLLLSAGVYRHRIRGPVPGVAEDDRQSVPVVISAGGPGSSVPDAERPGVPAVVGGANRARVGPASEVGGNQTSQTVEKPGRGALLKVELDSLYAQFRSALSGTDRSAYVENMRPLLYASRELLDDPETAKLPYGHLGMGLVLSRSGCYSEAIPLLERAVALNHRNDPGAERLAHFQLALAYAHVGDIRLARNALDKIEGAALNDEEEKTLGRLQRMLRPASH